MVKAVKRIRSLKPAFVADLIRQEAAAGYQVLVWTVFDEESEIIEEAMREIDPAPDVSMKVWATLHGKQKPELRAETLDKFRRGEIDILISKAKLLGYGMNFQMCGSMIFSGWDDSFEQFYQALRRAVRFGNEQPVRVHLPFIYELEFAQLENVLRKETQFIEMIERQERAYIDAMKRMSLLTAECGVRTAE